MSATARGDPDTLLTRLRHAVPVRELDRSPDGAITLHADWDQKGTWLVSTFPLRLDGELRPAGASAAILSLTIQPTGTSARYLPIWGALGTVGAAGIGLYMLTRPGLPGIVTLFVPIWIGWTLFVAYTKVTAGRRAATKASGQILSAINAL